MTANNFRAALRSRTAAFFLGAAIVAGTGLALTVPAEAAGGPVVGKPLQEAQSMAASGNYSGAMAKVHQAEGAGGLTGEGARVIARRGAASASKRGGGGPKAKFATDFPPATRSAVTADADELHGQLDGNEM